MARFRVSVFSGGGQTGRAPLYQYEVFGESALEVKHSAESLADLTGLQVTVNVVKIVRKENTLLHN